MVAAGVDLGALCAHERAMLEGLTGGERLAVEESVRVSGSVYFERHGRVLHGTRSEGRLSLDEYPVWREPLDCATDDETREMTLIAGAQTGKTSACRMMIACLVDRDPAPAIVALPTKDKVRRFAKSQIIPTVESIEGLSRQLGASASERRGNCTLDAVRFHHGSILFRFAGSDPEQLKSDPARYVYVDESEGLPGDVGGEGDPFSLLRNRQQLWRATRKLIDSSTPGDLVGMAAKRFLSAGCRMRYYVPCPACGAHAALAATGTGRAAPRVIHGGDPVVDSELTGAPDELREWYGVGPRFGLWVRPGATVRDLERKDPADVALVCPACGAKMREEQRMEMVQRGRYAAGAEDPGAPGGERVETIDPGGVIRSVSPDGDPVAFPPGVDPKPSTSAVRSAYAAFSVNVLSSPVVTLSDVAFELKSSARGGRDAVKSFVNNWLAEPWIERATSIHPARVRKIIDHDQPMWTLPEWTARTLLVADTQDDGWWWTVYAIGPGSRAHAVAWGFEPEGRVDPGTLVPEGWLALERHADRALPVYAGGRPSGAALRCAAMVVDSGGSKTVDVYGWCQRHALGLSPVPAHPVKGDGRAGLAWLSQVAAAPRAPDGSSDGAATRLLLVNSNAAKDRLAALVNAPASISARLTVAGAVDGLTGEEDPGAHDAIVAQLSAEHKVVELVGRPGRGKLKDVAHVWRPVKSGRANHLLDIGAYFVAGAGHLGLLEMSQEDPRVTDVARAVRAAVNAPEAPAPPAPDPAPAPEPAPVPEPAAPPPAPPRPAPAPRRPRMPSMEEIRRRAMGGGGVDPGAWP